MMSLDDKLQIINSSSLEDLYIFQETYSKLLEDNRYCYDKDVEILCSTTNERIRQISREFINHTHRS